MIGVVVSACAIGGVLYLLDRAWGYGTDKIPAPQGTMMKMLYGRRRECTTSMGTDSDWRLSQSSLKIVKIPVMPFAVDVSAIQPECWHYVRRYRSAFIMDHRS